MVIALIILLIWFICDPLSAGIVLGILIVVGIISGIVNSKDVEKAAKLDAERKMVEREERNRAEYAVQKEIESLKEKYGKLTSCIRLEKWGEKADLKKQILVFGESSLLYIGGKEVLFKDIISYSITDDYRIKHGEVEYESETKTSTGSLIGRGAVGAIVGGGVGAVIGASSASKNTTTIGTQKDDTIIHKYSLSINIRSLECPLIRISLGDSTKKAEEVNAIFTYIVDSQGK